LLLQWKGEVAGDNKVATLMKDFPARTADFKFNWPATDADVSVDVRETNVIDGKIIQSHGAVQLKRHVSKERRWLDGVE
jgi:hypothetical protein